MDKECLITLEYVNTLVRERPRDIHKGQCGRVLIYAGSVGMAGAAVLAARGALKSGAGLVKTAVPTELFHILHTAVPQVTCMDVSGRLSHRELEIYGAVAIGPGMGVDEKNYQLMEDILKNYDGPVVIDADGLNTLCEFDPKMSLIRDRRVPVIMTPHTGEADRMLTALGEADMKTLGRSRAAEVLAERTGGVILLKGADTLVTMRERKTYINTTGNPGMATGGSGDVLTGVIAALAASGIQPLDAAKTGAFIHGTAGDIAAERYGQWGMTAVEIEESLPAAFKKVVGK